MELPGRVGAGLAGPGAWGWPRCMGAGGGRLWDRGAGGIPSRALPHLWAAAAVLSSPWNLLRAPSFLSLRPSLGTLYPEASSQGPPQSRAGMPEVKPG